MTTSDPQQELKALQPVQDFFIGIDSDGCVFDSMEIKHKECFCPNFIHYFGLQNVSKYARETWEFVNLYSKTRGCNRFLAVVETLKLLAERPEVQARDLYLPDLSPLKEWISQETRLGNPALEQYLNKVNEPFLQVVLNWTIRVNQDIKEMVYGIGPFPYVREFLEAIHNKADAIVVSQTPLEALTREWEENKMIGQVRMIAGQEHGTKTEHLALAAVGKYPAENILMIGDAPGDKKAAEANGVLFFPINPGHEEESWEKLYEESLPRFFAGTFAGAYQQQLIQEFDAYLPEKPSWKYKLDT